MILFLAQYHTDPPPPPARSKMTSSPKASNPKRHKAEHPQHQTYIKSRCYWVTKENWYWYFNSFIKYMYRSVPNISIFELCSVSRTTVVQISMILFLAQYHTAPPPPPARSKRTTAPKASRPTRKKTKHS